MDLTTREIASLLLLGALLVLFFIAPSVRKDAWDLLKHGFALLLVPVLTLSGYVWLLTRAGSWLGIWDAALLKETAVWFVTVGLVAAFAYDKSTATGTLVRRTVLRTVEIVVVIEFLASIFTLSLWAEILLQLLLVPVALAAALATRGGKGHSTVRGCAGFVMAVAGLGLLGFSIVQLFRQWDSLDKGALALEALLPLWMTVGFLPCLLLFWAFLGLEGPARRVMSMENAPRGARLMATAALVWTFLPRLHHLRGFSPYWMKQMVAAGSFSGARLVAEEYVNNVLERDRALQQKQQRLVNYAGVEGEDADGRRLDQREFAESKRALNLLAGCQMGQYRNMGRYRGDMVSVIESGTGFRDLPEAHGISMLVSEDGQKWWAWRRTVTGWVFAIGAAKEPPDEWRCDGPEPPHGPPGEDEAWGSGPFAGGRDANW